MNALFGFLGTLAVTGGGIYQADLDNRLAIANAQSNRAIAAAQSVRYDYIALAGLAFAGIILLKKLK